MSASWADRHRRAGDGGWQRTVRGISMLGGLLVLVYFGIALGETKREMQSHREAIEQVRLTVQAEVLRGQQAHTELKAELDTRLGDRMAVLLARLDDIVRRLDRIERRFP